MTRTRDLIALAAAAAACTAMVLAPGPARTSVPPADPGTLAGAWPKARPFDLPGTVLSGWSFEPQVIVAAGEAVGTARSPDGTTIALVKVDSRRTPAAVDVIQGSLDSQRVSFDAFAVTATDVYFMRSTSDDAGYGTESLWRLPRSGGAAVRVVADAGEALFQGSVNDLQVAAGTLRWVATAPDDPSRTVLESMPLPAGPATARPLPDQYTLTSYPMLYSGQSLRDPATPELTSSTTGRVTAVHVIQPEGAACDPHWCVMQATDITGAAIVQLCHPDGTGLARLGDGDTSLVTTDPTLLDRFVALTEQSPAMAANPNPTAQLWLYDIAGRRSVEIAGAASATAGAGGWLVWSTGDNETLAWHALDLTTLR